jgi:phosphate transport system permease protein
MAAAGREGAGSLGAGSEPAAARAASGAPRRRHVVPTRLVGAAFAAAAPLFLAAILAVLGAYAWPSVVFNGLGFLTTRVWNLGNLYGGAAVVRHGFSAPAGASYGILVFLVGTLATSALALLIAVPFGTGVAVCLSQLASPRLAAVLSFFVELLAGVPSVVYGLWGFTVLVPWVAGGAGPFLARWLGFLPPFRGPVGSGVGLLAAGLVLAVMVLPVIAAVTRDVLMALPPELRENGTALGLTETEVIRSILLPVARPGILGAFILGLGRALGETMAVLMVGGSAVNILPQNVYSPVGTMAATIVSQLDSAFTDASGMAVRALAEMALVLFVISVGVNFLVPVVARGVSRTAVLYRQEGAS